MRIRAVTGGSLTGIFLAALSAACFATKGVFAKYLYADGWDSESVLLMRTLLALPAIAAWTLWRLKPGTFSRAPATALLGAAAAGALCYGLGASLDFYALMRLEVSLERVLLFSYPSMVVVLCAVIYRELPRPPVVVALGVTYAGIALVVSGFDVRVFSANLAGSGLVLGCALSFAIYYLASDRWTGVLGSAGFTLFASLAATVCLVALHLVRHGLAIGPWHARDAGFFAGLVIIATVLPMLSMAEGVRLIGAERASVVSTVGPPTTLLLGAWLLDERLRLAQWLGVALIVAGILILELARPGPRRGAPARA